MRHYRKTYEDALAIVRQFNACRALPHVRTFEKI